MAEIRLDNNQQPEVPRINKVKVFIATATILIAGYLALRISGNGNVKIDPTNPYTVGNSDGFVDPGVALQQEAGANTTAPMPQIQQPTITESYEPPTENTQLEAYTDVVPLLTQEGFEVSPERMNIHLLEVNKKLVESNPNVANLNDVVEGMKGVPYPYSEHPDFIEWANATLSDLDNLPTDVQSIHSIMVRKPAGINAHDFLAQEASEGDTIAMEVALRSFLTYLSEYQMLTGLNASDIKLDKASYDLSSRIRLENMLLEIRIILDALSDEQIINIHTVQEWQTFWQTNNGQDLNAFLAWVSLNSENMVTLAKSIQESGDLITSAEVYRDVGDVVPDLEYLRALRDSFNVFYRRILGLTEMLPHELHRVS